jgi:hypothetical protein
LVRVATLNGEWEIGDDHKARLGRKTERSQVAPLRVNFDLPLQLQSLLLAQLGTVEFWMVTVPNKWGDGGLLSGIWARHTTSHPRKSAA